MSSTVSHMPPSLARSADSREEGITNTAPGATQAQTQELSVTRHGLAQDINLLRVLNESALDMTDVGAASSLDLAATLTASDRVRRRSDVSRIRPTGLNPDPANDPDAIELPVLTYAGKSDFTTTTFREPNITFREDAVACANAKGRDPEAAPRLPSSLAPSVRAEDEASVMPSVSAAQKAVYRRNSLMHFLALCFCLFGMGWNDGTTGPMLPRIQDHYHVNFAIVSLIFVLGACGYVAGGMANVYLTDKFGFGKVLLIGASCQVVAYAMISPAGPFPLMCCAFSLIGFGLSLQNAQANGFVASLKRDSATKMGFLHGFYGLGALISPLVSTQFAKSAAHWSFHYVTSVGVYLAILAVLWFVFRGKRQEEVLEEEGQVSTDADAIGSNKYKQILALREVHVLALFALIYVGVEVTLGGWSVTFILDKRHGDSSSGYIASGFFGGMMLGRILLLWLNKKIGERLALFIYALIAIGLEVTVWAVPSLIENAIAVSFVGLVLGPMYPILMNQSTAILPRWLLTGCMGYIAGIGQAGSAVLPFLTGLLASKFGIGSLQPFIVSMMSTLIVIWALIPRARYVPT
ncbi:MFS general substrate transporter [Ganoderma leucocontextum]|nr:MFS general substrate transporter [Ganoderma leucocontextum]